MSGAWPGAGQSRKEIAYGVDGFADTLIDIGHPA